VCVERKSGRRFELVEMLSAAIPRFSANWWQEIGREDVEQRGNLLHKTKKKSAQTRGKAQPPSEVSYWTRLKRQVKPKPGGVVFKSPGGRPSDDFPLNLKTRR
jgi:hypothetical protein